MDSDFPVGIQVMEPFRGLCTVVGYRSEVVLGNPVWLYELKPAGNASTLKIPAQQMHTQGVRRLVSGDTMATILETAKSCRPETAEDQGQRMRRWVSQLRAGSPTAFVAILRELLQLQVQGQRLSSQEAELEVSLSRNLRQEISQAFNVSPAQASRQMRVAVGAVKKGKR